MQKNDIIAILLCGGQSSRMGKDKGLMPVENTIWAKKIIQNFEKMNLEYFISIRKEQQVAYLTYFESNKLYFDSSDFKGPMNGIMTLHKYFPNKHLLVLACDLPLLEVSLIEKLLDNFSIKETFSTVFKDATTIQPLIAIYTFQDLAFIKKQFLENKILKMSMKYILQQISINYLPIEESEIQYFQNFNEPQQLNLLPNPVLPK